MSKWFESFSMKVLTQKGRVWLMKVVNTETNKVIGRFDPGTTREGAVEAMSKKMGYKSVAEMMRCFGDIDHWSFEAGEVKVEDT